MKYVFFVLLSGKIHASSVLYGAIENQPKQTSSKSSTHPLTRRLPRGPCSNINLLPMLD